MANVIRVTEIHCDHRWPLIDGEIKPLKHLVNSHFRWHLAVVCSPILRVHIHDRCLRANVEIRCSDLSLFLSSHPDRLTPPPTTLLHTLPVAYHKDLAEIVNIILNDTVMLRVKTRYHRIVIRKRLCRK